MLFTETSDSFGVLHFNVVSSVNNAHLKVFQTESQVRNPVRTPMIGESTWWWWGIDAEAPPPADLTWTSAQAGNWACIPRHGNRPLRLPKQRKPRDPLPGANNIFFYDGHAEPVPLERLWDYDWHRAYVPPVRRPGL